MRGWVGVFFDLGKKMAESLSVEGFECNKLALPIRAFSQSLAVTGFERKQFMADLQFSCLGCYNLIVPRNCTLKTIYSKTFSHPLRKILIIPFRD